MAAAVLQAEMPELGSLSEGEAAALAGLAPYNCDSGPWKGTRRISGGRAPVRCALYMAALSAVSHDRILRDFYTRLCPAGKKPLVALAAAMRKLVVLLNHMLRKPQFKLASQESSPPECGVWGRRGPYQKNSPSSKNSLCLRHRCSELGTQAPQPTSS